MIVRWTLLGPRLLQEAGQVEWRSQWWGVLPRYPDRQDCELRAFSHTLNKGKTKVLNSGRRQLDCECFSRFETGLLQLNLWRIAADTVGPFTFRLQRGGMSDFGDVCSAPITPLLRDRIHWRLTPEMVKYKLCVMVFKALHGTAPAYIS